MRLSFIAQFLVLIAVGCCVYTVANKYQRIEKSVSRLDVQSEQEHENIRVLQAEWAYLTNPVRMEKIARDYFQMDAVNGKQLVALTIIPSRDVMAQNDDVALAAEQPELRAMPAAPQPNAILASIATSTAPVKTTPAPAVEQVQANEQTLDQDQDLPVASAMPMPAAQALPELTATPVSATVGNMQ